MSDLISREKALEEIEDWERCYTWDEHCRESKEDYIVSPSDVIANLPSAQRWVSCSERLPKEKGEYLVTYHPCYWDNVRDDIKVGIDSFRGKTAWAKKKYQRVIAWCELPKPWEGEQDGNA